MSHKTRKKDTCAKGLLMSRTQELLRKSDIPYSKIFLDTGITQNWLSKFVCDKIPEPGVNRVEALYTYLSGKCIWDE